MKKDAKEFKKYVHIIRALMPLTSNGRNFCVLSEESKKGQEIIEKASRNEGFMLSHIYTTWSEDKQKAYDDVMSMFANSRHGTAFSICSHNPNVFTVSWLSDDGLHYVTHKTEYLVIFNE